MENSFYDNLAVEKNEIKELQKYAAKFQLLTPEEETVLTKKLYDVRMCLTAVLLCKAQVHPFILSNLVNLVNKHSEELINRNLRLVLKSCQSPSYTNRGLAIADLFMEGLDGLRYSTLYKYNPYQVNPKTGRTNKFSTYTTYWIKQRIGRAIENKGSAVKIAGHVQAVMSKIRQVVRKYVKDTKGAKPTPETIVLLLQARYSDNEAIMNITAERVAELGRMAWATASLDEVVDTNEGSVSLMDYLENNPDHRPEAEYEEKERSDNLKKLLDYLDHDERLIITYTWGLIDYIEKKPKQIAKLLGIPLKDVQKKLQSGMDKLKDLADPGMFS